MTLDMEAAFGNWLLDEPQKRIVSYLFPLAVLIIAVTNIFSDHTQFTLSGKEHKLDYRKVVRSPVICGQWLRPSNNLFAHLMWCIIITISNQREL